MYHFDLLEVLVPLFRLHYLVDNPRDSSFVRNMDRQTDLHFRNSLYNYSRNRNDTLRHNDNIHMESRHIYHRHDYHLLHLRV